MALNLGTLSLLVTANTSPMNRALNKAQSDIRAFSSEAISASRSLSLTLAGVATAMAAVGVAAIKMASDVEQDSIAFKTMLGSAETAQDFLDDLFQFAAKTPFDLEGLEDASKKLLAFGFAAEDIVPTMTAIGDAVAALGGGAFEIDRVVRALGQIRAKGKVSAEEMMQLAELGIPAWELLARKIGISIPEAMKQAERGAIDAQTGINAILEGMTSRFGGLMAEQSKTLQGLFSTAKDNISMIMRTLGQDIVEALDLKTKLAGTVAWLEHLATVLREGGIKQALNEMFPPNLQPIIIGIAGAIAGALIPAFGALASAIWAALSPLLPFIAAGMALAGAAFVVYSAWEQNLAGFRDIISQAWEKIQEFFNLIISNVTIVVNWFVEVWSAGFGFWASVFTEAWNIYSEWINAIWDAVGPLVMALVNAWKKGLGVWVDILSGVYNIIKTVFQAIVGAFTAVANFLMEKWHTVMEFWLAGLKFVVNAFYKAFTVMKNIMDMVASGKFSLEGLTKGTDNDFAENLLEQLTDAKKIVEEILPFRVIGNMIDAFKRIGDVTIDSFKKLRQNFSWVIKTVKDFFKSGGIFGAVSKWASMAKEWFSGLWPALVETMQGIWDAIFPKRQKGTGPGSLEASAGGGAGAAPSGMTWPSAIDRVINAFIVKAQILGDIMGEIAEIQKEAKEKGGVVGPADIWNVVISKLITSSQVFANILEIVNPILQATANAVGAFLEPLLPLIQVISMVLTPVLKAFAVIASSLLLPVMQLLFPVLKFFGLAVLGLAIGIGEAWNAIANAINWALGWLGVHLNLIDTSGLRDSFNELKDLTWENAMAQAKAADAADSLAESLTNVPQGFRVALARYDASIPSFDRGGYMPYDGLAKLHAGERVLTPEQQAQGGGTIYIDRVECIDPEDFIRQLDSIKERRNIRRGAPATQYAY